MPAAPTINQFQGLTTASSVNLDANFTNINALLASVNNYSNYYVDTGPANACVVTLAGGQTCSLSTGLAVQFKAAATNTANTTLNVNGTGVRNIRNPDGTALLAGQIAIGQVVSVVYDGSVYKLSGQFVGGAVPSSITVQGMTVGLGGGAQSQNVAIGLNALSSNTTGGANTAVGESALRNNVIGTQNVAIGFTALNFNTGDGNTAVGSAALYNNIGGATNTAVGR